MNMQYGGYNAPMGLDMEGTWENPRTGEVINIRSTVLEGDQMIALTSDGRQIPVNKLSAFVRNDSPNAAHRQTPSNRIGGFVRNESSADVPAQRPFVDDVDIETASNTVDAGYDILLEDRELLRGNNRQVQQVIKKEEDTPIDKVLDSLKDNEKPVVDIHIEWSEIPEGVMFLKKYLGFGEEEISEKVINKFIDLDAIKTRLSEYISTMIYDALNPSVLKKAEKEKINNIQKETSDKPEKPKPDKPIEKSGTPLRKPIKIKTKK